MLLDALLEAEQDRETPVLPSPAARGLPSMLLFRAACATALALTLAGCASVHRHACATGEQRLVQESLYFGTAKPAGSVTPEEWADFLRNVVTPRFPQGLTVWPASGQWRGADGQVVREASFVLNIIHAHETTSEQDIREIVAEYKARFQQEAVLRVKAPACASF